MVLEIPAKLVRTPQPRSRESCHPGWIVRFAGVLRGCDLNLGLNMLVQLTLGLPYPPSNGIGRFHAESSRYSLVGLPTFL